jgi:hypothetical protein
MNCDDVVGIVTRLRAGQSGFRLPVGTVGPTQPCTQWLVALFAGGKQPGPNDHSPPFIAQVKNKHIYTCMARICSHGVDRGNFIYRRDTKELGGEIFDI